jgi:hypothetical protein
LFSKTEHSFPAGPSAHSQKTQRQVTFKFWIFSSSHSEMRRRPCRLLRNFTRFRHLGKE